MTSISSFTSPMGSMGTAAPDMLTLMRPALSGISTAAQSPTSGSADVNSLGSNYLQGATETVSKLDENIARRTKALAGLDPSDVGGVKQEREQLDLLERLRTRIQESINRVGDIMAGRTPEAMELKERTRQQLQDLDELEARRRQLAQQVTFSSPVAAPAPSQVASAYAAGA